MAGSDSTVYRGFYDTPYIQDRLRLYAQEEKIFQLMALRQANPLSILTIISEKFGTVPADMLTDWRFRYQEFDELPYSFTIVTYAAGSGQFSYVKLSNSHAAGLNTNHRLLVSGVYTKRDLIGLGATLTVATDMGTTFSSTLNQNEVVKVSAIGEPDSAFEGNAAASGYTWIKVKRCHPGIFSTITGTLTSMSGMTLKLVNSVAKTNQRPNPPVTANGRYLENVIQITRESYGLGEHLNKGGGIKTLLMNDGAAQLDMNLELTQLRLTKTIERGILCGKRSAVEVGNESEYETGGILEFIETYYNFNGIPTVSRINDMVSYMLDTAGVRELWMFGGSTYTKKLASAYESKRGFGESTELSVKYGLKVNEITGTGRDGIIYHVNAPILSEIGLDEQAIVLNLSEHNFGEKAKYGNFQIAEKVPMADLPDDSESYEKNSGFQGKWRELYTAWGLIRRLGATHFRVYGVS